MILLSTAYLAPIHYYSKLFASDEVMIEQMDYYVKQTYRNRCVIAAPDGPLALTIPTVKPDTEKAPVRDIRISDHGNWRHLHWNALVSAYNHTPYFEYYRDDFAPFYEEKRYTFLVDYNEALMQLVCDLIDLHPKVVRSSFYQPQAPQGVEDYRERIHPKLPFHEADATFRSVPYYQVFQERLGFLPNLSIVDLLFNMGPESLIVLQQSLLAK